MVCSELFQSETDPQKIVASAEAVLSYRSFFLASIRLAWPVEMPTSRRAQGVLAP